MNNAARNRGKITELRDSMVGANSWFDKRQQKEKRANLNALCLKKVNCMGLSFTDGQHDKEEEATSRKILNFLCNQKVSSKKNSF